MAMPVSRLWSLVIDLTEKLMADTFFTEYLFLPEKIQALKARQKAPEAHNKDAGSESRL